MEQSSESQNKVLKGKWNIRYLILWFMVAVYRFDRSPLPAPAGTGNNRTGQLFLCAQVCGACGRFSGCFAFAAVKTG